MNKDTFRSLARTARLGNLGTLTFAAGELYDWFLENVYDLRFPHVGDDRRAMNVRTFDSYRNGNFLWALKFKRQGRYVSNVCFCPICKGHHHYAHPCPR